jgi:general secretion pathway protein K
MNNRGMVLMSVLWVVLVVAFISFALAAAVRVEVSAAESSFDSERALFMAKGAAEAILLNLQTPGILGGAPVREEHDTYIFRFDSGEARVRLESADGLIDANAASDKLLASLFDSMGVNEQLRNELVDSILDWRDADDVRRLYGAEVDDYGQVFLGPDRLPRNRPFQRLNELLLVKHMTREIYNGHIEFDAAANSHRKVPGLRELMTVSSGSARVNVNEASVRVLAALPGADRELAAKVAAERDKKHFADLDDLGGRIPELKNSETIEFMTTDMTPATNIVSTATVQPSGTSRTVRLQLRRDRKKQIFNYAPLLYREIEVLQFERWEY